MKRDATRTSGDEEKPVPRILSRVRASAVHRPNETSADRTYAHGRNAGFRMQRDRMAKKMLIDASHAEETRVVVLDGKKVEEFDFESVNKRQLAGNIYLAKVTRVEPSLQAVFVEYGGNRHGFLAFPEIHPDYYQIPIADREALLAEERAYAQAQQEEDEQREAKRKTRPRSRARRKIAAERATADDALATREIDPKEDATGEIPGMGVVDLDGDRGDAAQDADPSVEGHGQAAQVPEADQGVDGSEDAFAGTGEPGSKDLPEAEDGGSAEDAEAGATEEASGASESAHAEGAVSEDPAAEVDDVGAGEGDDEPYVAANHATETDPDIESVADEDVADEIRRPRKPKMRKYNIQEVIKVRQILLVQVVREERGNKGAALTTYLSLAGRYCVLMPNTARGGGISRKITNVSDRKKLKEIASEIDVPDGAGLIIRTAGAQRTKSEIKRDYEYLQRMWEQIRELTLKSIAPTQIYEEGNLIKRTIRDHYNRDIEEVLVEGDEGFRAAKDFMKMIMPSHAKNVKQHQEPMPLFARYQAESYLASMFNPTVQLKSGGYIVIGVTEALVAIDVNSGKATREASLEHTALKTNLEAADEVARQLRLRDLAGLIVIDFIDMEERKNNSAVEKRFKEKLKTDRARIQVGRISGFGLLEMSRQRLRPGMIEVTTRACPTCQGTGLIRSVDSAALGILRQLEEEGARRRSREVLLKAPTEIVNYLVNQKREQIAQIEMRYRMSIRIEADPLLASPNFSIEKFRTATRPVPDATPVVSTDASLMADEVEEEDEPDVSAGNGEDEDKPKKRRRRRRRRKSEGGEGLGYDAGAEPRDGEQDAPYAADGSDSAPAAADESDAAKAEPEAGVEVAEEAKAAPKPKSRTRTRSRKRTAAADAAPDADSPLVGEPNPAESLGEAGAAAEAGEDSGVPRSAETADVAMADSGESEENAAPAAKKRRKSRKSEASVDAEIAAQTEPDSAAKPKRSGWWSAEK